MTAPGSGLSGDQIKRALREGKLYTGAGTGLPCEPEWRALIARCLVYAPERRATVPELLADVAAVRALAAHRKEAAQRVARLFGVLNGMGGAVLAAASVSGGAVGRSGPGSPRVQACWDGRVLQRTPSPAVRALPETLGLYVCAHGNGDSSNRCKSPAKPSRAVLQLNLPDTLGLCGPGPTEGKLFSHLKEGQGWKDVGASRGSSGISCGTCFGQENDRWGHLNLPRTSELWA